MRRSRAVLALLAGIALVTATACGSSGEGGGTASNDLRVVVNYPPSTLDPHKAPAVTSAHPIISLLYDRLTEIDSTGKVVPLLAKSWTFSSDGRDITFELRDDAVFWDGSPVDAEAVKKSLGRALELDGSIAAANLSMIESVDAVDATTVVVHANRPASDLPGNLAGVYGAIVNPQALDRDDLDVVAAGSGPYKLVEFRTGEYVTYERNADYWDPKANTLDTITITGMPNDTTRLNALRSGEADLALTTLTQYDQARSLGDGFEVYVYRPAVPYLLYMNTGLAPTDDLAVRRAISLAIDRDAINDNLLGGLCEPTNQPLAPGFDGHLEEVPIDTSTYDPDRARELLRQAGYGGGLTVSLLTNAGITLWEQLGTAVQAQLAEVGVTAEISAQDASTVFANWTDGGYHGWFNSKSPMTTSAATFGANYLNPARFPGPQPAGFAEAVEGAFDPNISAADRTATLEAASKIAVENQMDIYLCDAPAVWTATDRVTGADTMGWSQFNAFGDLRYVGLRR